LSNSSSITLNVSRFPFGRSVLEHSRGSRYGPARPIGAARLLEHAAQVVLHHRRLDTFSCPSVILTTLLGERIQAWDAEARYPDVPTALKNLADDLDAWLQLYPTRPTIDDPSCPGTNLDHRWDDAPYANFRTQIHRYSEWITTAHDEPDRDKSVEAWQKVLGTGFKAPAAPVAAVESASKSAAAIAVRAPGEEDIRSRFPVAATRSARVTGRVLAKPGFRSGLIRDLGRLDKNRELRFRVDTDVPWPYDVYWKVRNFGEEAARANGLRGQLMKASDPRGAHRETTLYTGTHWDRGLRRQGRHRPGHRPTHRPDRLTLRPDADG
jgi:hypothetical protein